MELVGQLVAIHARHGDLDVQGINDNDGGRVVDFYDIVRMDVEYYGESSDGWVAEVILKPQADD